MKYQRLGVSFAIFKSARVHPQRNLKANSCGIKFSMKISMHTFTNYIHKCLGLFKNKNCEKIPKNTTLATLKLGSTSSMFSKEFQGINFQVVNLH